MRNNGGILKVSLDKGLTYKYNKQLIYMDDLNKFMEYMREKCLVLKGFTTQDRNTHLERLEDDIINRGTKGGVK